MGGRGSGELRQWSTNPTGLARCLVSDGKLRVLSPSTARLDRVGKLVGTWGAADRVRAEPFEAVELELEGLWVGVEGG